MVRLFYSHPTNNFGDMLSPVVVERATGKKIKSVSGNAKRKLLAVGSLLNRYLRAGDTVWGSGTMHDKPVEMPKGVKILAVRGPLTRKLIRGDCPEIYGDPALLMPEIYQPKTVQRIPVSIIPHEVDRKLFKNVSLPIINVSDDVFSIIDRLYNSEVVIATNLHGVIVAQAYGVPVVWLKVGNRIYGGEHKFNDYLQSVGIESGPVKLFREVDDTDIAKMIDKVLPAPKINTAPLKRALKEAGI